MSGNSGGELSKTKRELATCKRQLKDAQILNERLLSVVGYDELKGWQPKERLERQYGWVSAWFDPLFSYMNQNLDQPLTPDVRNKICDIVTAIIAQLIVRGKYGIDLPHDHRDVDIEDFREKQDNIFNQTYEPCAICGEKRITHECHIIPRSEGGPLHRDNFVMLCPLHHHLFDHARLSKEEWDRLSLALVGKMEAAIFYASNVRLPQLQSFWREKG
jgi:hypothetical protein